MPVPLIRGGVLVLMVIMGGHAFPGLEQPHLRQLRIAPDALAITVGQAQGPLRQRTARLRGTLEPLHGLDPVPGHPQSRGIAHIKLVL